MYEPDLNSRASGPPGGEPTAPTVAAPPRRRATDRIDDHVDALTRFEREQLDRELADIERASAALRLGEPALRTWTSPAPTARKSRPLWLLIGALWLSTALLTAGAVAALATLAG